MFIFASLTMSSPNGLSDEKLQNSIVQMLTEKKNWSFNMGIITDQLYLILSRNVEKIIGRRLYHDFNSLPSEEVVNMINDDTKLNEIKALINKVLLNVIEQFCEIMCDKFKEAKGECTKYELSVFIDISILKIVKILNNRDLCFGFISEDTVNKCKKLVLECINTYNLKTKRANGYRIFCLLPANTCDNLRKSVKKYNIRTDL